MDKNINRLKESINKAVREALIEEGRKQRQLDTLIENTLAKQFKKLLRENQEDNTNKKHNVLSWLRQDAVNVAAIRRELEGEPETQEEEDAKRSYFMKKVHETDGKSFTDSEINALYAIKSRLGQ